MPLWLAVAAGGAAGALSRYGLSYLAHAGLGRDFPYGTLAVNTLGCFAAGLLYAVLLARAPEWRALLLVGFLGGFTTFSAFSLETLVLLQDGHAARAFANVILNLTLSLAAAAAGLVLARAASGA